MEHTISHSWRRRPFTPFNSKKKKSVENLSVLWRKQKSVTPLDCNRQGDRWKTSICTETYLPSIKIIFLHFLFTTKYCQTFYITFYYKMVFMSQSKAAHVFWALCLCVYVCVCGVVCPWLTVPLILWGFPTTGIWANHTAVLCWGGIVLHFLSSVHSHFLYLPHNRPHTALRTMRVLLVL